MYPNICPFTGTIPLNYYCTLPLPQIMAEPQLPEDISKIEEDEGRYNAQITSMEQNTNDNDQRQKPSEFQGQFPGQVINTPAEILRYIEATNPDILNTMLQYRIPLPVARRLIRRIIRIALMFCRPRV